MKERACIISSGRISVIRVWREQLFGADGGYLTVAFDVKKVHSVDFM